jgi:hypothetical protein
MAFSLAQELSAAEGCPPRARRLLGLSSALDFSNGEVTVASARIHLKSTTPP